jgi:ribulose-5-phosphate 4-epimerase/fuculose-1-phosphate aldolase
MTTVLEAKRNIPADVRKSVSPAEWEARVKLAACYRLMAHFGITDLTYNHLSARVPDHPDRYVIKGQHELFEEVTASSLLTYDLQGERVVDTGDHVSLGGLIIHGGIMAGRPDIMACFHTHTPANMGVSVQKFGLLPLTQQAVRFFNRVRYHDFTGFEVELAQRRRLVAALEDKLVLVMRNHGVLVCGRSIPEAFVLHHFFEMACRAQIAALSAGSVEYLILASDEIAEHSAQQLESFGESEEDQGDWPGLMRLAYRLDPTFSD